MKIFCLVLGIIAFMWSGRNGRVEARAMRNDFSNSSSNQANPFLNHLGIRAKHPEIDTSDLEEGNTDRDHFTDGFGRIRRIPIPNDAGGSVDENQNGEFRFKNTLRRHRYLEEGVGSDGRFPFIPGVLRRNAGKTQKKSETVNFENTNDDYPFINGLRELPMSRAYKLDKDLVIDKDNFQSNNHPVKKRSPEEEELPPIFIYQKEDTYEPHIYNPGPNAPTVVNRCYVEFGKDVENQARLMRHMYTKTLKWAFRKDEPKDVLVTYVIFPNPFAANSDYEKPISEIPKTNSCPITKIIVKAGIPVKNFLEDYVYIVEGGLGATNVTLAITSYNFDLDRYLVGIYGLCPNFTHPTGDKKYDPFKPAKGYFEAFFDA